MISPEDTRALVRDKYNGDLGADMHDDLARLAKGEPLAYVIGWITFLNLRIDLDSRPLIPRPETEQWTEDLIKHLEVKFGDEPFSFLDLCAGSGAIGLAILKYFSHSHVTFSELVPEHAALIYKNLEINGLSVERANVCTGSLFEPLYDMQFDVIATNPPYIPSNRTLDESVTLYEPEIALYGGNDGLDLIRSIIKNSSKHLRPNGELWIECDIDNISKAKELLKYAGANEAVVRTDQYGRERVLVGYF